eukprot:maker-scaffold606_size125303-snap-gene-0.22 protein:Tk03642 transcript:maker-scaffold606_size125303-snap-gene-0.22-mRNA-1 annotation:"transcription factor ap-2 epsilon"
MAPSLAELEAYASVISALRTQGELTKERRKILHDLSNVLSIAPERHKTEVRRAVNDERLATVAKRLTGSLCETEWAREGRRIIPLLRRAVPLTAYTSAVDEAQRAAERHNQTLRWALKTQTPQKRAWGPHHTRGLMGPPPPPLRDLIHNGDVTPPTFAIPVRPPAPDHEGDVIILPSGMAVRFKAEPLVPAEDQGPKVKRKRREPTPSDDQVRGSFEVLTPEQLYSPRPPFLPGLSGSGSPMSIHQTNIPKGRKKLAKPGPPYVNPPLAPMGCLPPPPGGLPFLDSHHGYARSFMPAVSNPIPIHEIDPKMAAKYSSQLPNSHPKMGASGNSIPPNLPNKPLPQVKEAKPASRGGARSKGRVKKPPAILHPPGAMHPPSTPTLIEETIVNSIHRTFNEVSATPLPPPISATPVVSAIQAAAQSPGRMGSGVPMIGDSLGGKARMSGTTSIHLKEGGLLTPGMKVIPTGARLLPKGLPGTSQVTASIASSGSGVPVYMMAPTSSPGGQANMVRMGRAQPPTATRVVTLSPGALKSGLGGPTIMARPAEGQGSNKNAFAPGNFPLAPGRYISTCGNRPSLIVLQRGQSLGCAKGIIAGQRIIQASPGGKPVVIVTKSMASLGSSTVTMASSTTTVTMVSPVSMTSKSEASTHETVSQASHTNTSPSVAISSVEAASSQAGNVIVYDMSKVPIGKNPVLSDILSATGIVPEEDSRLSLPSTTATLQHLPISESVEQTKVVNIAPSTATEVIVQTTPTKNQEGRKKTTTQVLLTRDGVRRIKAIRVSSVQRLSAQRDIETQIGRGCGSHSNGLEIVGDVEEQLIEDNPKEACVVGLSVGYLR